MFGCLVQSDQLYIKSRYRIQYPLIENQELLLLLPVAVPERGLEAQVVTTHACDIIGKDSQLQEFACCILSIHEQKGIFSLVIAVSVQLT